MQVKDSQGNKLNLLLKGFKQGGEGKICSIKEKPDLVAKIYHNPLPQHEAKLAAMIANPPIQTQSNHQAIAWPIDLLYQRRQFVGFVMPKVQGSDSIHKFYHPIDRKQQYPHFNWKYLHRTALNLVRAAQAIHVQGHIIGDINESNILANSQALVTFVDTDSFQVTNGQNQIYRCPVGKEEYTSPELHGIDFKSVNRTAEHDHFGLAVLIFRLLMEGWHPFAGVLPSQLSVGRVDLYCIKQGVFPYKNNSIAKPPPNAPSFDILHPYLQAAFVRCFVEGHQNPGRRPTAKEWKQILKSVEENALVICAHNPDHIYSNHLSNCPWCSMQQQRQQGSRQKSTVVIPQQIPLNNPKSSTVGFNQATLRCPVCNHSNNSNEIYCQNCAHQLTSYQTCRACNSAVPVGAQFCNFCGVKL